MSAPIRTFVYGSCVSRDTFEHADDAYELAGYVARQSLISAMTPAWAEPVALPSFESSFQQRMLDGDVASDLLARIDAARPRGIDLILWDLTDERLGAWCGADGAHLTRSVELLHTDVPAAISAEVPLQRFGTATHLAEWLGAIDRFAAALDARGLLGAVQPIAVPWAERNDLGGPTPSSFGVDAKAYNALALPYLEAVRRYVPRPAITVTAPTADSDHRWDEAPFHYTDDVYEAVVARLPRSTSTATTLGSR